MIRSIVMFAASWGSMYWQLDTAVHVRYVVSYIWLLGMSLAETPVCQGS